jgi:hypothetical protein
MGGETTETQTIKVFLVDGDASESRRPQAWHKAPGFLAFDLDPSLLPVINGDRVM